MKPLATSKLGAFLGDLFSERESSKDSWSIGKSSQVEGGNEDTARWDRGPSGEDAWWSLGSLTVRHKNKSRYCSGAIPNQGAKKGRSGA